MKIQALSQINGKVKQYSTPYIDEAVRDSQIRWDKHKDNKNVRSLLIIQKNNSRKFNCSSTSTASGKNVSATVNEQLESNILTFLWKVIVWITVFNCSPIYFTMWLYYKNRRIHVYINEII